MADSWVAPNRIDVVQRVNAEHPGLILNAHAFTAAVACELRKDDGKWGRNGKRGDANNLSDDVVAWKNPAVPWGCSIVDIIGGAGGPNPSPAWIDQTHATADGGAVGVWVAADCANTPPVVEPPHPGEPPVVPPPQPPAGPDESEIRFRVLNAKLDALLVAVEDMKHQQAADTDQIGKWMVEQASGVVAAVTDKIIGDLTPKIAAMRCVLRR